MRDKNLKPKAWASKDPHPERIAFLRERFGDDECRVQFVLWSDGMHLDVSGIWEKDGAPVFRPAACAWAAWQAAWALKTHNAKVSGDPRSGASTALTGSANSTGERDDL